MLRTALCDLLGIHHPVVQAGMGIYRGLVTTPELVAAVSNAGGMGCLGGSGLTAEELRTAIRRVRELTARPFGVDLIIPAKLSTREGTRAEIRADIQRNHPDHFAFVEALYEKHGVPRRPIDLDLTWTPALTDAQARVVLEEQVEVGCGTTIDRPSVGETRIGAGTKIDNLVQIGHGVVTGRGCALAAQVGIAGGARLGNGVILAGQVGVANRTTIGDRAIASSKSGLHGDIAAGEVVSGYPAIPNRLWLRCSAAFSKLPELARSVRQLKAANLILPEDRRLYASIGIGYGAVLNIDDEDLFGDEMNLACKLGEDIAARSEILLTEAARATLTLKTVETRPEQLSISGLALNYHMVL